MACDTLTKASEDGRLEKALSAQTKQSTPNQEAPLAENLDALRKLACDTLTKASEDGTLEKALLSTKTKESTPEGEALSAAKATETTSAEDIDALRKIACDTFTKASDDGRLEKAMLWAKTKQSAPDGGASSAEKSMETAPFEEIDALRQIACDTLTKASEDGILEKALSSVSATRATETTPVEDIDALRQMACDTLTKASEDGRLEKALSSAKIQETAPDEGASSADKAKVTAPFEDIDALRQMACDTLAKASENGTLEKALSSAKIKESTPDEEARSAANATETNPAEDIDALRKMACDTLTKASDDGSLEKALSSAKNMQPAPDEGVSSAEKAIETAPFEDIDALRQMACDTLTKASENGTLGKALSSAKTKESTSDEEARSAPKATETNPADDIDSLRKLACDTLTKASDDGSLEKALSSAKNKQSTLDEGIDALTTVPCDTDTKAAEMDALRKEARDILSKSSDDGSLETALSAAKAKGAAGDTSTKKANEDETAPEEDVSVVAGSPSKPSPSAPALVVVAAPAASSSEVTAQVTEPAPALLPSPVVAQVAEAMAEVEALKELTRHELNTLREDAHSAQQDVRATYDEVKNELLDLRSQTQSAQKEFNDLRDTARQIQEMLKVPKNT
jgi:hypothetical protein